MRDRVRLDNQNIYVKALRQICYVYPCFCEYMRPCVCMSERIYVTMRPCVCMSERIYVTIRPCVYAYVLPPNTPVYCLLTIASQIRQFKPL